MSDTEYHLALDEEKTSKIRQASRALLVDTLNPRLIKFDRSSVPMAVSVLAITCLLVLALASYEHDSGKQLTTSLIPANTAVSSTNGESLCETNTTAATILAYLKQAPFSIVPGTINAGDCRLQPSIERFTEDTHVTDTWYRSLWAPLLQDRPVATENANQCCGSCPYKQGGELQIPTHCSMGPIQYGWRMPTSAKSSSSSTYNSATPKDVADCNKYCYSHNATGCELDVVQNHMLCRPLNSTCCQTEYIGRPDFKADGAYTYSRLHGPTKLCFSRPSMPNGAAKYGHEYTAIYARMLKYGEVLGIETPHEEDIMHSCMMDNGLTCQWYGCERQKNSVCIKGSCQCPGNRCLDSSGNCKLLTGGSRFTPAFINFTKNFYAKLSKTSWEFPCRLASKASCSEYSCLKKKRQTCFEDITCSSGGEPTVAATIVTQQTWSLAFLGALAATHYIEMGATVLVVCVFLFVCLSREEREALHLSNQELAAIVQEKPWVKNSDIKS